MTGRGLLIVVAFTVAGVFAGAGLGWLLASVHAVSPDNWLAGSACGLAGTFGFAGAGLLIAIRTGDL